ncbi:MAG: glycosyltransferase [Planctomycetes bacterium]|nr:glycosyltransferase [Planctomycetota bacterium]
MSEVDSLAGLRLSVVTASLTRPGGTERYLLLLRGALEEAGVSLRVLTRDGSGDEELGSLLDDTPDPFRLLPQARRARGVAQRLAATSDLALFLGIAPFGFALASARALPTLLSVHTPFLTCPAGSRYLPRSERPCERRAGLGCLKVDQREGCLSFQTGAPFAVAGKLSGSLTRTPRTRLLLRLARGVIVNSEATRGDILRHGSPARTWVVHPPALIPPPPRVERDPRLLLFVGRLSRLKGVAEALEVLVRLKSARLEIVGDGDERGRLERSAKALGVEDRVTFRGWLDVEGVAEAMARASCTLIPSRWFEAFGQVGPQALQAGCPVVAYDVGGVSAWGRTAGVTLLPVGDLPGLSAAAGAWLERPPSAEEASTWSVAARERFGLARFQREYLAVLADAR